MKNVVMVAVLLFGGVIIDGCGQKDLTGVLPVGSIFVTSSLDGAAILLDGEETGKETPDSLTQVRTGDHMVAVSMACHNSDPASAIVTVALGKMSSLSFDLTEYERVVLLEDFSNTSCAPCVQSDAAINEVLDSYDVAALNAYGISSCGVVSIQYHVNWPDPLDPFYLDARPENNARKSYYGVDGVGVPYVVIDGTEFLSPLQGADDAQAIEAAVQKRLEVVSSVQLSVTNEINGSSGRATVELTALSEVPQGQYNLLIALVEGDIHYEAENGLTYFDSVLRDMLPNADGRSIDELSVGTTQTFTEDYTIADGWKAADLSVVAFLQLQDAVASDIIQAATSRSP